MCSRHVADHQRRYRVQRIKEKVRLELHSKDVQLSARKARGEIHFSELSSAQISIVERRMKRADDHQEDDHVETKR